MILKVCYSPAEKFKGWKIVDKKFFEKIEKALLAQKQAIISELLSSSDELESVSAGEESGDLADIASEDIERRLLEARGIAEVKQLKAIDSALARIKQGRYGVCVKCGKPIPKSRLEVLPYTVMCIDCKTADERKNI